MNTIAKTPEKPLELLERLSYKAPFKGFDPRAYPAFYEKHIKPAAYLDAIGMETVTELLLNQFSPKEIATLLQISQGFLLRWVQADSLRERDWEWALQQEADNLMFEAKDRLEGAFVPADKKLDQAEKIANHNRLMARGFGSKRWGQKVDVAGVGTGATVTYNFNVALLPEQQEKLIKQQHATLEHEKEREEITGFDFSKAIGSGTSPVDLALGISEKEELSHDEAAAQEEGTE